MRLLGMLTVLMLFGCHPGLTPPPMVPRLPADRQAALDGAWVCMLDRPDRVDRMVLLDAIVRNCLHWYGIDRFDFVSQKDVGSGRVILSVHHDRDDPGADELVFVYIDRVKTEIRRERYTGGEVRECLAFWTTEPKVPTGTPPQRSEEIMRTKRRSIERREQQIREATGGYLPDLSSIYSLTDEQTISKE